jgi:antitoxin (DNA-binding transcriptional repressor) of toxin-antitoxin stability system
MFSSLSCSAKSPPVTTIQQKLSKTPGTTSSLVAARTRTARVVRQAESGDEGVVTVAKEPKENDDVARGVADAVAAAEKAFEMDDATKEDDVSPSAVQQRAAAAM